MTNALVRRAAIDDADALFPIAVEFATSFTPERAPFGRALRELLDDASACLLVAVIEQRVCGYLLGFDHATFFANGRVAWVEEVAVASAHRSRGIGAKLMDEFEQWAKAREARLVGLATRRAAGFYGRLGYEESALYFRKLL